MMLAAIRREGSEGRIFLQSRGQSKPDKETSSSRNTWIMAEGASQNTHLTKKSAFMTLARRL